MSAQNINEIEDLFLYPELIPEQVQNILDSVNYEICAYQELTRIKNEIESLNYTFDFGLAAEPYDLRMIKN
jgi:hypothetical protein